MVIFYSYNNPVQRQESYYCSDYYVMAPMSKMRRWKRKGVSGLNQQAYLKRLQCAQNCVVIKSANPRVGHTTCQALRCKFYEYVHFTDEDTGAQRGSMSCLRSHS